MLPKGYPMTDELQYVNCPYCNNAWIPETMPVCKKCQPKVEADMALQSILVAIDQLEELPKDVLLQRKKVLDTCETKIVSLQFKLEIKR